MFAEPFTHAGNAPVSVSFSQTSGALRYPSPERRPMLRAQPEMPDGSTEPARSLLSLLAQGSTLSGLLPASQPT